MSYSETIAIAAAAEPLPLMPGGNYSRSVGLGAISEQAANVLARAYGGGKGKYVGSFDTFALVPTNIAAFTVPVKVDDYIHVRADEQRDGATTQYIAMAIGDDGAISWGFDIVISTDTTGKADKVVGAKAGNLASLDEDGNLTDAGKAPGDFAKATHADAHKTGGADALSPADIGALASDATAAAATKLESARTIQVDLSSTAATPFDGSDDVSPGIKGVLPFLNGGNRIVVAAIIGSTGTFTGMGISSVTNPGTGVYNIVFDGSYTNTALFALPSGTSQTTAVALKYSNLTATGVTITALTINASGVATVNTNFTLLVVKYL